MGYCPSCKTEVELIGSVCPSCSFDYAQATKPRRGRFFFSKTADWVVTFCVFSSAMSVVLFAVFMVIGIIAMIEQKQWAWEFLYLPLALVQSMGILVLFGRSGYMKAP